MDRIYLADSVLPTLVAVTEDEQVRGLMWKVWPPPVMTFPYDRPEKRKFWMKNTIAPLDIVFACSGRVVEVKQGIPLSLEHVGPEQPCDLVIELPQGMAKEFGVREGSAARLVYSLATLTKRFELKLSKNT